MPYHEYEVVKKDAPGSIKLIVSGLLGASLTGLITVLIGQYGFGKELSQLLNGAFAMGLGGARIMQRFETDINKNTLNCCTHNNNEEEKGLLSEQASPPMAQEPDGTLLNTAHLETQQVKGKKRVPSNTEIFFRQVANYLIQPSIASFAMNEAGKLAGLVDTLSLLFSVHTDESDTSLPVTTTIVLASVIALVIFAVNTYDVRQSAKGQRTTYEPAKNARIVVLDEDEPGSSNSSHGFGRSASNV